MKLAFACYTSIATVDIQSKAEIKNYGLQDKNFKTISIPKMYLFYKESERNYVLSFDFQTDKKNECNIV